MPSSRASELVSIIASNTVVIEEYLKQGGLPDLSFDAGPASQVHQHNEIDAQRQAVLDATDELHALMLGPKGILMSQPVSAATQTSLYAYKFIFPLTRCSVIGQLLDDDASNLPI